MPPHRLRGRLRVDNSLSFPDCGRGENSVRLRRGGFGVYFNLEVLVYVEFAEFMHE